MVISHSKFGFSLPRRLYVGGRTIIVTMNIITCTVIQQQTQWKTGCNTASLKIAQPLKLRLCGHNLGGLIMSARVNNSQVMQSCLGGVSGGWEIKSSLE